MMVADLEHVSGLVETDRYVSQTTRGVVRARAVTKVRALPIGEVDEEGLGVEREHCPTRCRERCCAARRFRYVTATRLNDRTEDGS